MVEECVRLFIVVAALYFFGFLRQLLGHRSAERSTLSLLELVAPLLLALLIGPSGGVQLNQVASEHSVEPLPEQVVCSLDLKLPESRRQLFFQLKVSLSHFVLEPPDIGCFTDLTNLFLPVPLVLLFFYP